MISHQAEKSFRTGQTLAGQGRARDALPFLSAAIELDELLNGQCEQARYLSYYGLCLCVTAQDARRGLRLCRQAVEMEECNQELWWNSARVALALGRKAEGHRALRFGHKLQSGHRGIRRALGGLGHRRAPVLTFLSRGNPANVVLGKLRTVLTSPVRIRPVRQEKPRAGLPRVGGESGRIALY